MPCFALYALCVEFIPWGTCNVFHCSAENNMACGWHLHRFDDANVGATPVGVSEDAWEVVLRRLAHMQAQDTNHLLSAKTMDALWATHGASTS